MKPNIFIYITLLVFLTSVLYGQKGIRNTGTVLKNNSGNIIKVFDGGLTNASQNSLDGKIQNNGIIIVDNNIYNNVTAESLNWGTIVLSGDNAQYIGGSGGSIHFGNLYLNNSSDRGVEILNNDQIVENKLYLNTGVLTTNNFKLILSNNDSSAISNYNDSSFVNGNLRRYITNNTQSYAFPIGDGIETNNYKLAILVNQNLLGPIYIDANFKSLENHNNADLQVQDNADIVYETVDTTGVWNLIPDANISSGSYDLALYINNFSNLVNNRFAILNRPEDSNSASDWTCEPCGVGNPGISDLNGEGRLITDNYAKRTGFNHFTQFGIGTIACKLPKLEDFVNICYGDSIVLNPGNFYSYQWSTGESNNEINVSNTGTYYVSLTNVIESCGVITDSIHVTRLNRLYFDADLTESLCYNSNDGKIEVSAFGGLAAYQYNWSNGVQGSRLTDLSDGTYTLSLTDANNCQFIKDVILESKTSPIVVTAEIGEDDSKFGYIQANVTGGTPEYNYYWSNNSSNNLNIADHLYAGEYTLTVSDANGCETEAFFEIEQQLIIPTVITPNNDSHNDTWDIVNLETFEDVKINIFNRWGDLIYNYEGTGQNYRENESIRWDGTWKGKKAPLTSYVYILNLGDSREEKGVVTIIY